MLFRYMSALLPLLSLGQVFSRALPLDNDVLAKRTVSINYAPGGLNIFAAGTPFVSLNGVGFFLQNSDSNLVVYANGVAKWNSGFGASPVNCAAPNKCELVFQYDGNLVKYVNGKATWNTVTAGTGHTLVLSDVWPYMAIYNVNGKLIWATYPPGSNSDGGCLSGSEPNSGSVCYPNLY